MEITSINTIFTHNKYKKMIAVFKKVFSVSWLCCLEIQSSIFSIS